MNELVITGYDKDTLSQVSSYMSVMHDKTDTGALGLYLSFSKVAEMVCSDKELEDSIKDLFGSYKYCGFKLSVNRFKRPSKGEAFSMKNKDLFFYEGIVFDIVAKSPECKEDKLVTAFLEFCRKTRFPVPNGFSYTGDGGVHLHYSLKNCLHNIGKGLKGVRFHLGKRLKCFLDDYSDASGQWYELSKKSYEEDMRDILPGTMNLKTGRMCEFFSLNVDPYSFDLLMDNCRHYGDVFKPKVQFKDNSRISKFVRQTNREFTKKEDRPDAAVVTVNKRRVLGLFELKKMGYKFICHEEEAVFLLSQCLKRLKWSESDIRKAMRVFLRDLYPVSKAKLDIFATDNRVYKFRNETIAKMLGFRIDDPDLVKAFHIHPRIEKKFGLKKNTLQRAKTFIAVAKILKDNMYLPNQDIADKTGLTLDQVKKAAGKLRKSISDIEAWSKTSFEDTAFILGYFAALNKTSVPESDTESFAMPKEDADLSGIVDEKISGYWEACLPDNFECGFFALRGLSETQYKILYIEDIGLGGSDQRRTVTKVFDPARVVYSSEYYANLSKKLFSGVIVAPKPDMTIMFGNTIGVFPQHDCKYTFRYYPSTIRKYHLEAGEPIEDYETKSLLWVYYKYVDAYKYMLKLYRRARKWYKYGVTRFDPDTANNAIELAKDLIDDLIYLENAFAEEYKKSISSHSGIKGISAYTLNKRTFIYIIESNKAKAAYKSKTAYKSKAA